MQAETKKLFKTLLTMIPRSNCGVGKVEPDMDDALIRADFELEQLCLLEDQLNFLLPEPTPNKLRIEYLGDRFMAAVTDGLCLDSTRGYGKTPGEAIDNLFQNIRAGKVETFGAMVR
jgi:hypothetical protein